MAALVDPKGTYSAFGHGHVEVSVTVDGRATPLATLPLAPESNGNSPRSTVLILISAPAGAPVWLRATAAGRAEVLDLRTGKLLANSFDMRQSDETQWSGSTVVVADPLGMGSPGPSKLGVVDADIGSGPGVATLTNYAPAIGWAPKGSAILLVPAPCLEARRGDYAASYEQFDDRNVLTFRSDGGRTVRAQPYPRELELVLGLGDADDTPVSFVVPADTTRGTVTMDLAKAQFRQAPSLNGRLISWIRPPTPFTLGVELTH